ncbi:MAG: ABC transporter substrate-binding protein [Gemmatimonadales bacterium]
MYASGADLQSINPLITVHPLAKAVQKHVLFLTLASYDSTFTPTPRLARWNWSRSRTRLTLKLRPDVTWHDGVPTRAADVVWTLNMARDPSVAYPRARDLASVRTIREVDSLTVRIQFVRPQPRFPDVLTDLAVLPAHRFVDVQPADVRRAEFNLRPVGNGPFEFVEYRPNERWIFRRSERFPVDMGRPEIRQFVVVVVDEAATKLAALTSGELDFAGISPAHADFVRQDERLQVIDYPLQLVYAIVWNLRRRLFEDVKVRRALTMALDRQVMVDAYVHGFGTVADGPVAPEHPWFTAVQHLQYDTAGAKRLLREAGWSMGEDGVLLKNGRRFEFNLLTVGSGDVLLEEMIQAQLRDVGIEVHIKQFELASFLAVAQSRERNFDALVTGLPGDFSLGFVAASFGSVNPGPLAYSGYASAEFDRTMNDVRTAKTEEALKLAWEKAQRILAEDQPVTWLYHAHGLQGASRRINHARIDYRGELAAISEWRIVRPDGAR